jgi:hypothetical protein
MKKITFKNYQNNSTIFIEENGQNTQTIDINYDGIDFENQKDLEDYIKECIAMEVDTKEIEDLDHIVFKISIGFQNKIK